jgi:hypothetical protein
MYIYVYIYIYIHIQFLRLVNILPTHKSHIHD